MKIKISTDSTCDLPAELIAAHNVGVLPLYIIRDGEALRDGIDVTPDDLYAYTKATGKLCGTSAVTIADYLTAWNGWLEDCDAIVHVVRCFEDENIIHVNGRIDPADDITTINLELILADLETVQKRGDKARKMIKSGEKRYAEEADLADRLVAHLENEQPVRTFPFTEEERAIEKDWFLLTDKPVLYAANIGEDDLGKPEDEIPGVQAIKALAAKEGAEVLVISAQVEEEIAQLEPDEKKEFLADLGIERSGLERLVERSYSLLGLISFLTCGTDEVRAWTIRKGTKAPQAAGKIHSDFERGFIRAEIVPFETLVEKGSMAACRELGLIRSEGRDYVMKDGDVTLFRFNV